ncbi:TPA: hypothetical protein ACIRLS_002444 [Escherichia coli]
MSKIDYQALREAAVKATWGDWDSKAFIELEKNADGWWYGKYQEGDTA